MKGRKVCRKRHGWETLTTWQRCHNGKIFGRERGKNESVLEPTASRPTLGAQSVLADVDKFTVNFAHFELKGLAPVGSLSLITCREN